jgi:exopolysaccharide production protein ExoQ
MILLTYLPEVAGFLLFNMMGTQLASIGPLLVLAEFAIVGGLFLVYWRTFAEIAVRWWWLLAFPLIAVASTAWSAVPMVSLRYSVQLLFTCFVGVLIARLMTPRRFVMMLMAAFFVFSILCILNGRKGPSAEGWVLIGLTGSKNQIGYISQILLMSSLTTLLMRDVLAPLRWIALLSLPLAAYLLYGTHSATALLMAVGGSFLLIAFWWSQRLPPGGRLGTIIGAMLILSPLVLLAPEITAAMDHFMYSTLGKDSTLTGRTFLWERADVLIARQPLLGYGYQAIWMGDSSDTIGLLRLADVEDGRTFHFHHQFRQVLVDTGLVGFLGFVGVIIAVLFSQFRQYLLRPDVATSFFFVLFGLMVIRGFADLSLGPFSVHALIWFASGVYAFWRPEPAVANTYPAWQGRAAQA